jgi:Glucose / Sorbosone dehydrogenase
MPSIGRHAVGAPGAASQSAGAALGSDGSRYEAEFGQNALDEINLLQRGNDYGWPTVEGTLGPAHEAHTAPLLTCDTDEASPSGLAFAGDSLWLATLQGERVYRIPVLGPGRLGEPSTLLDGQYGRLRTMVRAPDGSLWVTTSNRDGRGDPVNGDDRIIRVPLIRFVPARPVCGYRGGTGCCRGEGTGALVDGGDGRRSTGCCRRDGRRIPAARSGRPAG